MRTLVVALLLTSVPSIVHASPPGAHNYGGSSPADGLIARSRAEDAAYVLRMLRATCASNQPGARSRCAEGLRLLAEARDEMLARRAAAATQQ